MPARQSDVKDGVNKVTDSGYAIFSNPFYTAIVATIIVMIIVIIVLNTSAEDTTLKRSIKMSIYVFVGLLTIIFLHNNAMTKTVTGSAEENRIMSELHDGGVAEITGAGEDDIVAFPEISI